MLSQGEPRDVARSFDTTASCMQLLWYSMGFLYRPTSISNRSNAAIAPHSTLIFTALTQNHGDNRGSWHTTKIMSKTHGDGVIVNT